MTHAAWLWSFPFQGWSGEIALMLVKAGANLHATNQEGCCSSKILLLIRDTSPNDHLQHIQNNTNQPKWSSTTIATRKNAWASGRLCEWAANEGLQSILHNFNYKSSPARNFALQCQKQHQQWEVLDSKKFTQLMQLDAANADLQNRGNFSPLRERRRFD